MAHPGLRTLDACARAIAGVSTTHADDALARRFADPGRIDPGDIAVLRGHGDAAAFRHLHHDRDLHRQSLPADRRLWKVFDALENLRTEVLAARQFDGAAKNLAARFDLHCERLPLPPPDSSDRLPADEALVVWLGERLLGPGRRYRQIEAWRAAFDAALDPLADSLARCLDDQQAYGAIALRLAARLDSLNDRQQAGEANGDARETESGSQEARSRDPDGSDPSHPTDDASRATEDPGADTDTDTDTDADRAADSSDSHDALQAASVMSPAGGSGELSVAAVFGWARPSDTVRAYRVFSTRFDEEIDPASRMSPTRLAVLRRRIDAEQPTYRLARRLAHRLQRRLLARLTPHWDHDADDGVLDPAALTRVIVDPASQRHFRRERRSPGLDTAVTLLLDNSASMRGRPLMTMAVCADVLAWALEQCAVTVEVLGFTTVAWRGGRSRQRWEEEGRPGRPGRLNDLRHIVYKSAGQRWRQARDNLGFLMQPEMPKENIDGEALLWASRRLARREEQRRILIIVSDGAPSDESTSDANPDEPAMLEQHLRNVIDGIERRSGIELIAIGVGADVGRFYSSAIRLDGFEQLPAALIEGLGKRLLGRVRATREAAGGSL